MRFSKTQAWKPQWTAMSLMVTAVCLAAGCSDDDDDPIIEPEGPTSFTLTVENVSDALTEPSPLAPGVWATTNGSAALFDIGARDRGEGLEGLAEDGLNADLLTAVAAKPTTNASGSINDGGLAPGGMFTATFEAEPGERLHFATMLVASNDLFYSPSESGINLFNGDDPVAGDVTSMLQLLDAGTEINEAPGAGSYQPPNMGGATEGVVQPVDDGFTYPDVGENISVSVTSTPNEMGANFMVTIENLAGSSTPLAPGVWVTHNGMAPYFSAGAADDGAGLEELAEDGDPAPLQSSLSMRDDLEDTGTFGSAPIGPGMSYSFSFDAEAGNMLSFATMFVQSNDLFYAPGMAGIELFPGGVALGSDGAADVTAMVGLWDAGTEINEEPGVGMYQAPRQSGANSGPTEGIVQTVQDGYDYPAVDDVIRVTLTVN